MKSNSKLYFVAKHNVSTLEQQRGKLTVQKSGSFLIWQNHIFQNHTGCKTTFCLSSGSLTDGVATRNVFGFFDPHMLLPCVTNAQINWWFHNRNINKSIFEPSMAMLQCIQAFLWQTNKTFSPQRSLSLNLFNRMFSYLSTHCNCSCCIFELNCLSRISVKNITSWLCQLPPDCAMWNYSLLWSLSLSKCRPIKTLKRRLDKSENTFIISVENTTHNLRYHFQ